MTQTAKPKLSDMSGYGADDVVILERKTYEELLAALTNLLETIEKHTTTNKSGFAANFAVAWWKQQARAVISKAEGR